MHGEAPTRWRLGYQPALDGLRGIALVAIFAVHVNHSWASGATTAVDLFFVLSAFLITVLLLEERHDQGRVDLRAFWMRRVLRLGPALVAFVPVAAALAIARGDTVALAATSALAVVFELSNLVQLAADRFSSELVHTWTLSMEEQFYLLFPPMLLLLLPKHRPARRGAAALLALVAAVACWRALLRVDGATYNRLRLGLDTHADVMLVGCLAAVVVVTWAASPPLRRLLRVDVVPAVALLTWLIFEGGPDRVDFLANGGYTLAAVAAAVVIGHVVVDDGALGRVLASRALVYLGRRSYALYLWHYPVILATKDHLSSPVAVAIVAVPVSLAIGEVSWRLVEQPVMRRYRGRWVVPKATVDEEITVRQPLALATSR